MHQWSKIVGILNLSPDSFSDGTRYTRNTLHHKIQELISDWADIIDVGAESTAPWSSPVSMEEELSRLNDFFWIMQEYSMPFSLDTTKAEVAKKWIECWVSFINDVSGGRADSHMIDIIAQTSIPYIVMYSKNHTGRADHTPIEYPHGVVEHILQYFEERISILEKSWVNREQIILDPGMGKFISNDYHDSVSILQNIDKFKQHFWLPILIGTSRKWFLKEISPDKWPRDRVGSSLTSSLYAMTQWTDYLRVHDVRWMKQTQDTRLTLHHIW